MSHRGSGVPGVPVDRNPGAAERIPADPRRESWKLRVTGWAWLAMWELVRRMPESWAHALAQAGARWALRRPGPAYHRVRRNLSRVVPPEQLDDTVREAFHSYARYWVEAFRAADLSAHDVDRRTTTRGFEKLDAVLEEGRGAIVLLAHHGSWDVAAQWGETHGYHLAVVAEVLRPRSLFRRFVKLRESVGLEVVPLRRGGAMVGRLAEVLAANHMVGLLAERDLTGKGPVVDFFGEPTRLPPGPVVLSQRTGVPIVPAVLLQKPGLRWHFEILDPFSVDGMTVAEGCARLARALEEIIRTDPAQWHAFQPVWLADLPPGKRGGWEPQAEAPA
jgi:lauroyl/myristoyl acyltransferase